MSFRSVPKSVTLNDLERHNGVISANSGSFRAHWVKVHVRYLISWWVLVIIERWRWSSAETYMSAEVCRSDALASYHRLTHTSSTHGTWCLDVALPARVRSCHQTDLRMNIRPSVICLVIISATALCKMQMARAIDRARFATLSTGVRIGQVP